MAASAHSSSNHSWFGLLGFKMVCILSSQKSFLLCGLNFGCDFQVHPQRFQPSVVIVSCIGQRFSQYVCDFLQSAALKVHHLDSLSLSGIQFTDAALDEPGPLASVHARYVVGWACPDLLALHNFFLFVEVADAQIASPQKRPEIRKLQNPGLDGTLGGIKPFALKEDGQKHFLENVFGLGPF